ncbi:hypothetical protein SAMN04487895_101487 [Paenibacillus sophorae]|uniref:Uncharacterized protein n=1 Tax=Paenibacillus sophorae TaxID=1333845 RepID=A0A1H8GG33_9BACL|nr:hypothetical protein [Paenibacillus sophorae]QWU14197.1 hypothetical protein KP014_20000 [Paenibacillus sophorae]SEN42447.1 hypothetical protein SAMN04487895_101487 [Paenibacillus sophorae]
MIIVVSLIIALYLFIGINVAAQFKKMEKNNLKYKETHQTEKFEQAFQVVKTNNGFLKLIHSNKMISNLINILFWPINMRIKLK